VLYVVDCCVVIAIAIVVVVGAEGWAGAVVGLAIFCHWFHFKKNVPNAIARQKNKFENFVRK